MKEIIAPIERGKIMAELTPERFLRHTNKGGNEIYVVNYKNAPYTMQEIGRLREIAFRSAGGGTGKEVDIDMFDTMEKPCQQLIVWDPDAKEILGGYRFILGEDMQYDKKAGLSSPFPTCSISLRNSFGNICRTPSNWAGHSFLSNTNRPDPEQKAFSPSIICGTD